MASRWSWASVSVAVVWLVAFAVVAIWEVETSQPFSLRGGQAGLAYPWTAAMVVIGGPLALAASFVCLVLTLVGRSRTSGAARQVLVAALGPVLVVVGGLALYCLFGLLTPGNRP